jgi:hypothetical protein
MVAFIVDIQYYPVNGDQILKEATALSLSNDTFKHYVFCSPVHFNEISAKDRKTARYINEELGVVHFDCGVDILQAFLDNIPREALLIVNGHVKKQLLKSLLPHNRIVDLKVPFYSLTSLRKCTFPSYHTQCSLTNCYKIKTFFKYIFGSLLKVAL